MVVDCFTFFNEKKLLKARLQYLNAVVDRFVISEAAYTHRGKYKGFLIPEMWSELEPWHQKITYIQVHEEPPEGNSWWLENHQRNSLQQGLEGLPKESLVLISDIDEIPFVEALPACIPVGKVYLFLQEMRFYYPHWAAKNHLIWEGGTKALCLETILRSALNEQKVRYNPVSFLKGLNEGVTLTKVRLYPDVEIIPRGGVHWSWMGGVSAIMEKMHASSHQEIDTKERNNLDFLTSTLVAGQDPLSGVDLIDVSGIQNSSERHLATFFETSLDAPVQLKKPLKIVLFLRYVLSLTLIRCRHFVRKIVL